MPDPNSLTDKIDALAAAQLETAQALRDLLTRDPKKEFGYGPQFDPNVTRRFQSNLWRSIATPAGSNVPIVTTAPNSVEEVTALITDTGETRPMVYLRVDMDNNQQFTNVPADGREATLFLPPSLASLNAFNPATGVFTSYNFAWNHRFPCVLKWIRFSFVTTANLPIPWPATARFGLGFHGQ